MMESVLATASTTALTHVATYAVTDTITRIMNFKENLELLRIKMSELQALREDVERRIAIAENNTLMRTAVVKRWLERVELITLEVTQILEDGSVQIEQGCGIVGCYPNNWWTCYKLGKKVYNMLMTVDELLMNGLFEVVADPSVPRTVQRSFDVQTVGMDGILDEVSKLLREDKVKILGIYGMGGVGKTTLLKTLNNVFGLEACQFDVVIWVDISREFKIQNVQEVIMKRLGLEWNEGENRDERAARIWFALNRKKFLILLDDIWEPVKLESIGIPSPKTSMHNSKVIFTTRSEAVCGNMESDMKVKVEVLRWDESWILFQQKVGQEALESHPQIQALAMKVAKECHGLPLALITIARSMSSKKTPEEWQHAVTTLKTYAAEFKVMEEKVLATLFFSYENLEDDTARKCFLYFCLYPEDYNVPKLDIICHWIGEGFLSEAKDMDAARNKGHYIIGILKEACLLESGADRELEVKMHDVLRDLALWIGRENGTKKNKLLVSAGVNLTEAPAIKTWEEAERISLMINEIEKLTIKPESPNLLTLLLQQNLSLTSIAEDFFECMTCLKVLDLSSTIIEHVPKSVGGLCKLESLNLSDTCIKTLPEELARLVKLKYLNLSGTSLFYGDNVRWGIISHLSKLEMLDISQKIEFDSPSSMLLAVRAKGDHYHPSIEDQESLTDLRDLGITVRELSMLSSVLLSKKLRSCIMKVAIVFCEGLTKLALAPSSSILGKVTRLQKLTIAHCVEMEELEIISAAGNNNERLLESLNRLELRGLSTSKIIWCDSLKDCDVTPTHFKNLSEVVIDDCAVPEDFSWLFVVPILKSLAIRNCKSVKDILLGADENTFSRLETLLMVNLPKLERICQLALPLYSLKHVEVTDCRSLKELPFAPDSTRKPSLLIMGSRTWWRALEFKVRTAKSSFEPFFHDNEVKGRTRNW